MNDNSQLREQMWDLVYGLLEQDESQDLIARIKSDPQAARLYAEVRLQADLVGYASQVEDSSLVLTGDSAAREVAPAASRWNTGKAAAALSRPRTGNILVVIVATALALLIGVGIFWPQVSEHQLADGRLVISFEAPRNLPGGITNEVPVRIARLDGVGQMAEGEATVFSADGSEAFSTRFLTNGIGHTEVSIPGEALQPGAKLKVAAVPVDASRKLVEANIEAKDDKQLDDRIDDVRARLESASSSLTAELPVREEPQMQYLFYESPVTEPGQENQLAMWNLNTYSTTPAPADVSEVAIEDTTGTWVAKPTWRLDGNVSLFLFTVPETGERREMRLVLRDSSGETVQAALDGVVMQKNRQSTKALAQKDFAPYNLAKTGAADDRLPRKETDAAPSAAIAAGLAPATPPAPTKPGESLAEGGQRQSAASGYARANDLPAQQPANPLDRAVVVNEAGNEALAEVTKKVAETAASKGVTFEVPAEYASRRLKMEVKYRGLDVAERWIEAEDETVAQKEWSDGREGKKFGRPVAFDVPPEVNGPIEMQLYDSETNELLQRQVVVRKSPRKLNVQIVDGKDSYAPGETVSLTLQFTDENGQPAPGTQGGVRVWNEQVVQSLGRRPVLLAEALQTASEDFSLGDLRNLQRARSLSTLAAADRAKQESESVVEELAMSRLDSKQADAVKSQVAEASRTEAPGLEALPPAATRPAGSLPDASAPAGESAVLGGQGLGGKGLAGQELNGQAPDSFGFGGEGFGGGSGSSNFYADDVSKSDEYRLETRFGEAETPVLLATNSLLVQAEYEAARRQAEEDREAARATIGRILLFGGIGAAALLGLLMLWKLPAKARVLVPSLAIVAASVVLGLSWIGVRPGANWQQIARVDEQAETEHAKPAARPMSTPAPTGAAVDQLAMDADTRDPAALGGPQAAGGAGPAAPDYGSFAAGGIEAANRPAPGSVPADAPAEGAPHRFFAEESPAAPPGAGGFAPPSGGAVGGPAGRGGAESERDSALAREGLNRQKSAELAEAKQMEARKAATDVPPGKNLQEEIGGRGGGVESRFDKPLAQSTRASRAATEPAPALAEPPATTAPAAPSAPRPAADSKPEAAGAPAPAAAAPISAESDEKDGLRDEAGKSAKGAARDKPGGKLAASAADNNDENRDKADRFGAAAQRRSDSGQSFRYAGDGANAAGAPISIYFNPRLIADEKGRGTIEFTMPPVESEYRLLIDALGHGRIGSLQQVIECKEPAK